MIFDFKWAGANLGFALDRMPADVHLYRDRRMVDRLEWTLFIGRLYIQRYSRQRGPSKSTCVRSLCRHAHKDQL